MDYVIRIIKLPENLGILIDGVSEPLKPDIKRQQGGFLGMLFRCYSVRNLLTGKSFVRAERRYNNIDHMDKILVLLHPLSNIEITKYFN